MIIERPWENFYCDRCVNNFNEDMCRVKVVGFSNLYCPQVVRCEWYKCKERDNL